jgi:hypothetical protein
MDLHNWHKELDDKNITLIYSGPLWPEGVGCLAGTLKKHLEHDEIPVRTSHEVFSVFVEQMNNMLMYSVEKAQFKADGEIKIEFPKGTFVLGTVNGSDKKNKTFFLQTGNVIKNQSIELVKNRIDYLNTLDKNELRNYYKEQMKINDDNPESKGAGLGFIEIARRISSKIEYSFMPYREEGLSFFTLSVTIG